MSQFDYLQKIGLDLYVPGESFFHLRHPSIRIIAFILLIIAITLCDSIIWIGFFLLLLMASFLTSKISIQPILQTTRSGLFFILLIVILQIVIHQAKPGSELVLQWMFIRIYDTALIEGCKTFLRIITLISCIVFFSSIISSLEINHGMEMIFRPLQKIGINTSSINLVIQIMLRFLPILAIRMEEISKSQASRGAEWDAPRGGFMKRIRLFFPFIIPLFISSLQQVERTTDAIISRAYGLKTRRTHYYQYTINFNDFLLLGSALLIVYLGLFPPLKLF